MEMNEDVIAGKWKQLQGKLKQLRARIQRDRLGHVAGQVEVQVGRLQERYGVAHARARRQLKKLGKQTH